MHGDVARKGAAVEPRRGLAPPPLKHLTPLPNLLTPPQRHAVIPLELVDMKVGDGDGTVGGDVVLEGERPAENVAGADPRDRAAACAQQQRACQPVLRRRSAVSCLCQLGRSG